MNILAYAKAYSGNKPLVYHIGLEYKNGQYSWQTSNISNTIPVSLNFSGLSIKYHTFKSYSLAIMDLQIGIPLIPTTKLEHV